MERRLFNRIAFPAEAKVSIGQSTYTTMVVDLSFKGALIVTPGNASADTGESVSLKILLEDQPDAIALTGKVRHLGEKHIGIETEELDIDSATLLRRVIELNLADEALLQRDLQAMIDAARV